MLSDCKLQRFKAGSSGGQYSLLLSFVKSTARSPVEGTKESSPYTNPLKIHMPIIFKCHGNLCVSSIVLASNEGSSHSDFFWCTTIW